MILIAGGDSFVWGSELKDSPHGGSDGYSKNTFPALLSKDEYVCAAYPGIGNREIHDRMAEAVTKYCQVLVCWTWQSRDNDIDSDRWIISLQKHLRDLAIPYMFTCVDNCVVTNNELIDYSRWFMFPPGTNPHNETITPRGFYQWALENKYTVGPDGHPLEDAHSDAFNLMKDKFNELVKKID